MSNVVFLYVFTEFVARRMFSCKGVLREFKRPPPPWPFDSSTTHTVVFLFFFACLLAVTVREVGHVRGFVICFPSKFCTNMYISLHKPFKRSTEFRFIVYKVLHVVRVSFLSKPGWKELMTRLTKTELPLSRIERESHAFHHILTVSR